MPQYVVALLPSARPRRMTSAVAKKRARPSKPVTPAKAPRRLVRALCDEVLDRLAAGGDARPLLAEIAARLTTADRRDGQIMAQVARLERLVAAMARRETTHQETNRRWQAAEHAAVAAREQLRDAVNCIKEGFALFDRDDRLVLYNRSYLELHGERFRPSVRIGATFEEILRQNLLSLGMFAAGEIGPDEAAIQERLARHRAPYGTIERKLSDGRTVLIDEAPTSEGGIVHVVTDITSIKQQKEAIRSQSLLLQTTLESIDEGI